MMVLGEGKAEARITELTNRIILKTLITVKLTNQHSLEILAKHYQ